MPNSKNFSFVVSVLNQGRRLDQFLASQPEMSNVSRSMIQNLVRSCQVTVNGALCKPSSRLSPDDKVDMVLPPPAPCLLIPEKIFFQTLYEDDDLIVLSKPPGLVVHPACGHAQGTLVHGLLYHCRNLSGIGGELRPGIVHRLDKDTSGAMVVAKNDVAHQSLAAQFKGRKVKKIYQALLIGCPPAPDGTIDLAIGRHPVQRKKMAIREQSGRSALTHWKILEAFDAFTLVEIKLDTGRTHQIRVHMASLGCPVAGDTVYGGRKANPAGFSILRQCLHAHRLSFFHPRSHERLRFVAPIWDDIVCLFDKLR